MIWREVVTQTHYLPEKDFVAQPEILKNRGSHGAIRNRHQGALLGAQFGRAQSNVFDNAALIANAARIAHQHGAIGKNRDAAHHIFKSFLRAQTNSQTSDAESSKRRRQVPVQDILENQQRNQEKDGDVKNPAGQRNQGSFRIHSPPGELVPHAHGNPISKSRERPIKGKRQQDQQQISVILPIQNRRADQVHKVVVNDDGAQHSSRAKPPSRLLRQRRQSQSAPYPARCEAQQKRRQPTDQQSNRREQHNREPLPQRHAQKARFHQKSRQALFQLRESQRVVDFRNLIQRLPRDQPNLHSVRYFRMNQIQRKRFGQATRATHDDLLARRSALLPAGRIISDGVERTNKFCVEDVEKLLRKFLFGFESGAAACLKILISDVVIFRLRCANKTNHGATRGFTPQLQWIGG